MFGKRRRQLSAENRRALLLEAHRFIEQTAEIFAKSLVDGKLVNAPNQVIAYPPNNGFAPDELEALQMLVNVPHIESVMRKLLAAAADQSVHDMLCIIDGVRDPNSRGWSGVSLLDKESEDSGGAFLHDAFFDCYWDWRTMRPDKGWKLDLLDGPAPA